MRGELLASLYKNFTLPRQTRHGTLFFLSALNFYMTRKSLKFLRYFNWSKQVGWGVGSGLQEGTSHLNSQSTKKTG